MSDDPYVVLGVPTTASFQQVSEAYRALAQIYHPDRYAEAPERVREEALRRMQAVNEAYDVLGKTAAKPAPPPRPRAQPPRPSRSSAPAGETRRRRRSLHAVLYVDGSKHYHDAAVAPLGLDLRADPVAPCAAAPRCAELDGELSRWFQGQTRNASMSDKLMFGAWNDDQRAVYAATVGCNEVLLSSVEPFATPCRACAPRGG